MLRKKKKVPLRTCIACRTTRPKRELTRLVRLPSGEVKFDPTGKLSGRGAYLCPSDTCIRLVDGKKLSYALQMSFSEEDVKKIRERVETYFKEQEAENESS